MSADTLFTTVSSFVPIVPRFVRLFGIGFSAMLTAFGHQFSGLVRVILPDEA